MENDWIDIWRIQHQDEFKSTFIRKKPAILLERLDYILISSALQQHAIKSYILPIVISDHARPVVEFEIEYEKPGPGFWKMNTKLLEDEKCIQMMVQTITEQLSRTDLDIFEKWDFMKFKVKEAVRKRSKEIANSDRNKVQVLNKKLEQLFKQRDETNEVEFASVKFKDTERQISNIKMELEEINMKQTDRAIMKTKANYYELGDKPSKYFFALEKYNYSKKVIKRIRNKQGEIKSKPEEVHEVLHKFFENLYTPDNSDVDMDYLGDLQIPQVNAKHVIELEGAIRPDEIKQAMLQLKAGKVPGTDGLGIEFYKKFWPMIASHVHRLFNTAVQRGMLHKSARESIYTLLEKPDKDPLEVLNWRPISLLNTDYKIYAKVIANRLQPVAKYTISEDQTGFLKGRKITDNLLDLLSIIQHCEDNHSRALILAVDFFHAFDLVKWEALETTLKAFGFGEKNH